MPEEKHESSLVKSNCTIFLGYTSNMISSGIREYIKFLVQHKMVCDNIILYGNSNNNYIVS